MHKAVELLVKWDTFNQHHPDASLEDFCRYLLAQKRATENPATQSGQLLRIMGRIMSAFGLYHRKAMAQTGMPSTESFFFLNGIAHFGEIKKTDLINSLFFEYTTGMEAISKLVKNNLVVEKPSPHDRRAKLLALTDKGKKVLNEGYLQAGKVGEMIFKDVPATDINLCIQLLGPIEKKHSKMAIELKNESFEDMYRKLSQ